MRRLIACLALVVLAGPATACINDLELAGHEREFRSQYRGPASPPPPPPSGATNPPVYRLMLGGGAVLLLGAAALALSAGRPRA